MLKASSKILFKLIAPSLPIWVALIMYKLGMQFMPEGLEVRYSFGQFMGYVYGFWLAAAIPVLVSMTLIFHKIFIESETASKKEKSSEKNISSNEVQSGRVHPVGPGS